MLKLCQLAALLALFDYFIQTADCNERADRHSALLISTHITRRDSVSANAGAVGLTKWDTLRRAIRRSNARTARLRTAVSTSLKQNNLYTPVNAQDGEFVMTMGIGSPKAQEMLAILDTGSDLIWTQCAPCGRGNCLSQSTPLYDPQKSVTYVNSSCNSTLCQTLKNRGCNADGSCTYVYGYGDSSMTAGVLATEVFTVWSEQRQRNKLKTITFGCGKLQSGSYSNSSGIVGMGWSPLSLVSQLGDLIQHTFSYCLTSLDDSTQSSPLVLGVVSLGSAAQSTPLIKSSAAPIFYYVEVTGLSVAGQRVNIPDGALVLKDDGRGGIFVDSGTTLTYFPDPAYEPFLAAVKSAVRAAPVDAGDTGLDLCYPVNAKISYPEIGLHFRGEAKMVLPVENSFVQASETLVCLAFASAGPSGSVGTLGNVQQQNFHVVYDLNRRVLSFEPATCASLAV